MTEKPEAPLMLSSAKSKLEFLNQAYDRVNQQATQADTKAGVILSFHSVWTWTIASQATKLLIDVSAASPLKTGLWITSLLFLLLFALSLAISVYNAIMIVLPRLTRHRREGNPSSSLIFFGEIATFSEGPLERKAQAYWDALNQATDEALIHDYITRICDVSEVVQAKYERASRSIRYSMVTFAAWACTLVLLILLGDMT